MTSEWQHTKNMIEHANRLITEGAKLLSKAADRMEKMNEETLEKQKVHRLG